MSGERPYTSADIDDLAGLLREPFLPYEILTYQSHMIGQSEPNSSRLVIKEDMTRDISDERLEEARQHLENAREQV